MPKSGIGTIPNIAKSSYSAGVAVLPILKVTVLKLITAIASSNAPQANNEAPRISTEPDLRGGRSRKPPAAIAIIARMMEWKITTVGSISRGRSVKGMNGSSSRTGIVPG
ncbi:MAG: hypothetical protein RLZZ165_1079 [Bacteroidota bacterium]